VKPSSRQQLRRARLRGRELRSRREDLHALDEKLDNLAALFSFQPLGSSRYPDFWVVHLPSFVFLLFLTSNPRIPRKEKFGKLFFLDRHRVWRARAYAPIGQGAATALGVLSWYAVAHLNMLLGRAFGLPN
jgi:hypothetical protein